MQRAFVLLMVGIWIAPQARPQQAALDEMAALRARSDFGGALKAAERLIEANPAMAEAWRQKGLALIGLKRHADAAAAFSRAFELNPKEARALVGRALAYRGLNRGREAMADYDRAIAIDPKYSNAYMNRAGLKQEGGDGQGALADLDAAIGADPANAAAVYSRGIVNARAGHVEEARADFERSLAMDPKHAYAATAKSELARLPAAGVATARAVPAAPREAAPTAASPVRYEVTLDRTRVPLAAFNQAQWIGTAKARLAPPLPAPPPGPAAHLPESLDINQLSPASYNAVVVAAKEAMRILAGPLGDADEQRFEMKWAPLFEYPSQPVVEYFNKLTPLLNRMIETRAALGAALGAFNNAYEEAVTAAGLGDNAGVEEAMSVAGVHRNSVAALDIGLVAIGRRIEALGEPPDPLAQRNRARKVNEAAARFVKAQQGGTGGMYFVLVDVKVNEYRRTSDGAWRFTYGVSEGFARGSAHHSWVRPGETTASRASAVGQVVWTAPPALIKATPMLDLNYTTNVRMSCSEVEHPEAIQSMANGCTRFLIDPATNSDNHAVTKPEAASFAGPLRVEFPRAGQYKQLLPVKMKIEVETPGGITQFFYHYDLKQLTAEQAAAMEAQAAQMKAQRLQGQAEAAVQSSLDLAEVYDARTQAEAKLESIAFAKANQAYFQSRVDEYRAAAAGGGPDAERNRYLAMVMAANLQAEKDNQTTAETGEWTRTRTEYDDWNFQVMAAQGQAAAREYQQRSAAMAAVPRLLAQLPKELRDVERSAALAAVGEAIARGDTAGVQKAVNGLAENVKGYWTKRAAAQQSMAETADVALGVATKIKAGADNALFALSFLGGGAVYSGYLGITGGVEGYYAGGLAGGFTAAAKSVVASVHPAAMVSISAYDGYQATGTAAGAVEAAAKSAAMALAMQKVVAPAIGWAVRSAKGPAPQREPTVEQRLGEAQFQSRMANGRAKVKLFEQRAGAAEKARAAGDAKAAAELDARASEAAKAIKCDYTAKMVLNQRRESDPALMRTYLRHDEASMAQVERGLAAAMARDGYATMAVKRFSNSASDGKAGMDVDIGLSEPARLMRSAGGQAVRNPEWDNWRRAALVRKGPDGKPQRVSVNQVQQAGQRNLQAAFDQVYGGPGRPTKEGFVNFTTSSHAEAYNDPAWIGRRGLPHADFDAILPGTAAQAGEVTAFKLSHATAKSRVPDYLKLQEGCRTLVKDIDTKLAGSAAGGVNPKAPLAKAEPEVQRQVLELRRVMDAFARNEVGPIEADRRIRALTGGEGLPAVVRQYQSLLEAGTR